MSIDATTLNDVIENKHKLDLQIYNEISCALQPILKKIELLKLNIKSMHTQQIEEHLINLNANSQKLNSLINGLISITKSKKWNNFKLKEESIKYLIKDTMQEFFFVQHKIRYQIQQDLQNLLCDKAKIQQVLRNLLLNAIQFSDKNSTILIQVSAYYKELGGDMYVKFTIHDYGIGIPEEEKKSVFEPFIKSSRTPLNSFGNGLGLTIVKYIVEDLHKGEIWIESDDDVMITYMSGDFNNQQVGTEIAFILPSKVL